MIGEWVAPEIRRLNRDRIDALSTCGWLLVKWLGSWNQAPELSEKQKAGGGAARSIRLSTPVIRRFLGVVRVTEEQSARFFETVEMSSSVHGCARLHARASQARCALPRIGAARGDLRCGARGRRGSSRQLSDNKPCSCRSFAGCAQRRRKRQGDHRARVGARHEAQGSRGPR